MTKTTLFLTIAAVGLLAVGGLATAVVAKPGPGRGDQADDHRGPRDGNATREERQAMRSNHTAGNHSADRMDRHERMRAAHDAWQDCKREAVAANESVPDSCGSEKAFFLNATHARREGHALVGAIAALERQIGRLEVRQMALEDRLEDGNLSANQTAAIQERIEKIDAAQERLAEKLDQLKARLDALHEKWQSVRDEVKERRHGEDDQDDEEDEEDLGSSSSSSSSSGSA
jgi:hypothetical protein